MILTTNLGIASCGRIFDDPTVAAAMLDRFLHRSVVFNIDIVDVARAATYGAVDTLLVDIDAVVPGRVDETTGAVTFGHGVEERHRARGQLAPRMRLTDPREDGAVGHDPEHQERDEPDMKG